MTAITIKLYQYCAGNPMQLFDVDALVVGDLAIHRPVFWFHGQEPKVSDKGWVVTHIPSGLQVTRAMPDSYKTRKVMKAWAVEFQRRAASIFTDLREGRDLTREAASSFYTIGKGVVVA